MKGNDFMREEYLAQMRAVQRQMSEAVETLQQLTRRNSSILEESRNYFGSSELTGVNEANDGIGAGTMQLSYQLEELECALRRICG